MEEKKIAVIGVGGRTGTMFAFELRKRMDVLGVGRNIEKIQQKKFFIERKGKTPQLFEGRVISDSQWPAIDFLPEIIFLTTKNPVYPIVKYYYQKAREKNIFPTLVLSQNGIGAIQDTLSALEEIFAQEHQKIRVVRMSLFNPIDRKEKDGKVYINYSLPIRISLAKASGPGDLQDFLFLFKETGILVQEFPREKVEDMEFSKLFLNLIGMASATRELSIKEGFKDSKVFEEEVRVLKEYIKVVKRRGNGFVNFSHYPVKFFASLIEFLPTSLLLPFKTYLAQFISKEREEKAKDLAEIKYYNGVVVHLGEENKIPTPINQKILSRALK